MWIPVEIASICERLYKLCNGHFYSENYEPLAGVHYTRQFTASFTQNQDLLKTLKNINHMDTFPLNNQVTHYYRDIRRTSFIRLQATVQSTSKSLFLFR